MLSAISGDHPGGLRSRVFISMNRLCGIACARVKWTVKDNVFIIVL